MMAVGLARKLHSRSLEPPVRDTDCDGGRGSYRFRPMAKDYTTRFAALLLALLTIAAVSFAWINFTKEREYQLPYDGVWWVAGAGHLEAQKVALEGPGARAGVRAGDVLVSVDDHAVNSDGAVTRARFMWGFGRRPNTICCVTALPLRFR